MADKPGESEDVGKKKPAWLMPAVGVVMLLAGLGGGYFLGSSSSAAEPEATAEAADGSAEEAAETEEARADATVSSLGTFVVNLRDGSSSRVLQMEISVESSSEAVELIEASRARLRDTVLMLSSDFSTAELEGMDGKLRLRDEIHRRINAVLAPQSVTRVYFTAFVVQ